MHVKAASILQPTPMKISVILCLKITLGCVGFLFTFYVEKP